MVLDMRTAYENYAKDTGIKFTLGKRSFNERLESRGCQRKAKRHDNSMGTEKVKKYWFGVTLSANEHYEEQNSQWEIAF